MIHVEKRHYEIIKNILKNYPYQFYAFGSRVKGTNTKFSDLDLCYKDNITLNMLSHIKEDFEESNLPFEIDLIDWSNCTESFKQMIEKEIVPLEF